MSSTGTKIDFVETRPVSGPSGLVAATEYLFNVGVFAVTVVVQWGAIRTIDGGQLSRDQVELAARTLIEIEIERRGSPGSEKRLILNSSAMDSVARRLGWLDKFYSVSVSDYSSSVDEWRTAQAVSRAELPKLNSDQKEFARKFGITEEEYARSLLAGQYGEERMRDRGRGLGEEVGKILEGLGPDHRVVAVQAEMFNGRWIVRVQTPDKVVNVPISRELVDDVLDSRALEQTERLRVCVLSALGRTEFIVKR